MARFRIGETVNVKGKTFTISKSPRKNKQRRACSKEFCVDYGDPEMPEFPFTKRGDNYCARSFGLGKSNDTLGKPSSANFWSRKDLWSCKGKKSIK